MAKGRKIARKKPPAEIVAQMDGAVERIRAALPADDPAALFATETAGLAGYEPEVIERLAGLRSVEALGFLEALSERLAEKSWIKAARRAVYVLEQVGVRGGEASGRETAPVYRPAGQPVSQGYLTPFERGGERFGILTVPAHPKGVTVGVFTLNLSQGLTAFDLYHLTEGRLKRFLRNASAASRETLTEVPARHARFVLAEAAARARKLGRPVPADYQEFTTRAGSEAAPEAPVVYELIDPAGLEADARPEDLAQAVLDHAFVADWLPAEELTPYLPRIEEIETSVLVLTEAQKAARREAVFEQAARELFPGDKRRDMKRRLEETALLLWQRGETSLAGSALILARDIDEEAKSQLALARPDFIQELVNRAFVRLLTPDQPTGEGPARLAPPGSGLILSAR